MAVGAILKRLGRAWKIRYGDKKMAAETGG